MLKVQVTGKSNDPTIAIRQEAVQEQRLLDGLQWLEKSGAILRGHFKFGKGNSENHGSVYIFGRRLFSMAFASKWLTQSLYAVLPVDIRNDVEIVAGPQTAGIIMARDLADAISSSRKKGEPSVEALFLDKDRDGGYQIHKSDEKRLKGKKLIIVDDVRHRGVTFAVCTQVIRDFGGRVIATAELIDRGLPVLPQNAPNFFVGQLDPDLIYKPIDCPMCKAGMPITKF